MATAVSSSVIILLLFAFLCWTCCSGQIKLCSGFKNGTRIPATVGKPVTISFCVQWQDRDGRFNNYISITLPNDYKQIYHIYSHVRETTKLKVEVDEDRNRARINITIKKVKQADLRNVFAVEMTTIHRVRLIVVTFKLVPADPVTYVSSPRSTTTPVREQCCPGKTPACPENWYQVDNDTCLLVFDVSLYNEPSSDCVKHGTETLKYSEIDKFNCCLQKIHDDLQGNYMGIGPLFDGEAGIWSYGQRTQRTVLKLACYKTIQHFKSPTVSLFSLQIRNRIWDLADNSTGDVTVNTTFNYFKLSCRAEGFPTPTVLITDESQKEIKSGEPFTLANCSQAGVYTCTAKSHLGSSQPRKTIQIINPISVTEFTAARKPFGGEIRPGDDVEMKCLVGGCPKQLTITKGTDLLAEATSFTNSLVHEIKSVNCSHMGTYTCLSKFLSGPDVEGTADLGVKACPVSLCQSEDTPRELFPILGENITFSLCLMSTETIHRYSDNKTKMFVKFTKTPGSSFYWTAHITMYGIQASDYINHTLRIENINGAIDYSFTLKYKGAVTRSSSPSQPDSSVAAAAWVTVGVIVGVIVTVAVFVARVFFQKRSQRSEAVSEVVRPNTESEELAGAKYESVAQETPFLGNPDSVRYVEIKDAQYEMPVE